MKILCEIPRKTHSLIRVFYPANAKVSVYFSFHHFYENCLVYIVFIFVTYNLQNVIVAKFNQILITKIISRKVFKCSI